MDTYKNTDHKRIRDICPFNIYGRIVYKMESGCLDFYSLLNYKGNKTLLWEKSRLSLERDWGKNNVHITVELEQYEQILKSVLSICHFNYLKQFMIKLFRNNLYFKNITSKFADSGIMCNSCKLVAEDRIHFFRCRNHNDIIQKLFFCFTHLKLFSKVAEIEPLFYNTSLPLNHPTNLIYISTIKCMYNLRYLEIVPTFTIVKNHISQFVATTVQMYLGDQN